MTLFILTEVVFVCSADVSAQTIKEERMRVRAGKSGRPATTESQVECEIAHDGLQVESEIAHSQEDGYDSCLVATTDLEVECEIAYKDHVTVAETGAR
jgi:hypothetical protein